MQVISRDEALSLGQKHYFTGKPCRRGHIDVRRVVNHACLSCHRENQRDLLERNPAFKERQREAANRWKKTPGGREILRKHDRARKRDPEVERIRQRELQRKRRAESVQYRIKMAMSRRIAFHIRKGGKSTSSILQEKCGYTIAELMAHLEKQFLPGMTWQNYGRDGWHVDHIVPVDDFDLTNTDEFSACWSLGNLRPLWAKRNSEKSNKRLFLL